MNISKKNVGLYVNLLTATLKYTLYENDSGFQLQRKESYSKG
jgi:hypothetical protein